MSLPPNLPRDENHVTVAGGISDSDLKTILPFQVDPVTGRVLVSLTGGAGVSSINTLTGAVILAAGTNITLTPVGNTITIAAAGGASGITSLNGLTAATQTFANSNDTNITLSIGSNTSTHTFTMGWTGTLAAARLNANVVQGITNDTNVTGSIATQVLTLGWTGTLAAGRLNSNVVQSITNDTNITGSITAQVLTLGFTGTLAAARLNANVVQAVSNDTNITGSIATQTLTFAWSGTLSGTRGGTGVNNGASTITIAGNFVVSTNGGTIAFPSASTTMTMPAASTTIGGLGTTQTWTGQNTFNNAIDAVNAITAVSNAATVPVTFRQSKVTNNSAATLTVTFTTSGAVDGQLLLVRIYDFSAAAQTLILVNTENSVVTPPASTNGSTTSPVTLGLQFNSATTKWRIIAAA